MAGITLTQAQTQLDAWLAASAAVALNQSYSIGNRSLSRADAGDIMDQIKYWEGMVQRLTSAPTRKRTRFFVN